MPSSPLVGWLRGWLTTNLFKTLIPLILARLVVTESNLLKAAANILMDYTRRLEKLAQRRPRSFIGRFLFHGP